MNKYDYTYIIRYRYHEEEDCKIGYYCSNSCDFPTSEELYGYFNLEEGDEVEVEYQIANDFNGGKYLSDTVIYYLNRKELSKEHIDAYLAYIGFISTEQIGKERKEYAKNVVNEILDNLQRKNINTNVVYGILNLLNVEYENNGRIISQLREFVGEDYFAPILSELAPSNKRKDLKYQLEKMDKLYNIREEQIKYRVGVLILRFMEQTELLYPKVKGTFDKCMKLICKYYEIDVPKGRRNLFETCKDNKTGRKIYDTIRNEHIDFWDCLP